MKPRLTDLVYCDLSQCKGAVHGDTQIVYDETKTVIVICSLVGNIDDAVAWAEAKHAETGKNIAFIGRAGFAKVLQNRKNWYIEPASIGYYSKETKNG